MNPITVTESACKAFLENLQSDGSENKYVRVFTVGGGCSGLLYRLDLAEEPSDGDIQWEQGGVRFLLDELSRPFMEGMTIDYSSGLQNSGFQFLNPKSSRTCGCGSSFSV